MLEVKMVGFSPEKSISEGEKKKIVKNKWPKKWKIEKWIVYAQKIPFLCWSPERLWAKEVFIF